jgi:hypothetical protein
LFIITQLIEQCSYFQIYFYSLIKLFQFCRKWIKIDSNKWTITRFIRTAGLIIFNWKRLVHIVVNFLMEKVGPM